jgi:NTP pyrophosphatase (non-canonical NTP hydrolase)
MSTDIKLGEHPITEKSIQEVILSRMTEAVYRTNVANGWFDPADRDPMVDCMLLVTEVAEMAEAIRDHEMDDEIEYKVPLDDTGRVEVVRVGLDSGEDRHYQAIGLVGKPVGFASEVADVLVRLLDTAHRQDVNLSRVFDRKLEYNATRGYKHGNKSV